MVQSLLDFTVRQVLLVILVIFREENICSTLPFERGKPMVWLALVY